MSAASSSIPSTRWAGRSALALGVAATLLLPWLAAGSPGGRLLEPARGIGFALATTLEAVLFLVAARRSELASRTRWSLRLLAIGLALSSSCYLAIWASRLGLDAADRYLTFYYGQGSLLIWVLSFAALVLIPAAPLKQGYGWRVALDGVTTVGGLTLVMWVVAIHPALLDGGAERRDLTIFTALQCLNLVVLVSLLVRGVAQPVRRAIWCLISTVVVDTCWEVAVLRAVRVTHDYRPSEMFLLVDHALFLAAAFFFLRDPISEESELVPEWLKLLNPLPALTVAGVGLMAMLAVVEHTPGRQTLVGGLVVLSLLVVGRSLLTSKQALELMESERRAERQADEQKLAAVSRLAAGVAHEFNNLMTPVVGYASLALSEPDAPPVLREYLEPINSAAERSINLTRRLLEYTGSRVMARRPMELNALLTAVRPAIEQLAGSRIETEWHLPATPLVSEADEARVAFVVTELARNAREAVGASAGRISVRLWSDDVTVPLRTRVRTVLPGRYAVIEVADTGCGIASEDLDRIFDPFFSSHPFHESRGLGLSAVRGIVDAHKGGVDVYSVLGMGSRFRVYLPLATSPALAVPA